MRQTQKLLKIQEEALSNFNRIQEVLHYEREQCLEDRRFYSISGAQWEGKLGEQFASKPKFEINKIHLSIIKIVNEYRNNRISVNYVSSNKMYDGLSEMLDSMYRAVENQSNSEEAYDNAFEEGTAGGFGAWRLINEYEDEYDPDNDHQVIKIEPIYDADTSVYFDLDAKNYDKSDAKYAYIVSSMTHDSFVEEWKQDPTTWPKEYSESTFFDWATPDVVYVAEYYKIEEVKESLFIYESIDGEEHKYYQSEFENDEKLQEKLNIMGVSLKKERKIKSKKVRKYILSGSGVLEDCGYIAGKCIPIVPYYGKRWFIDNVERCMGHVRLSKDVQRLKNMQTSKLAEISALSTVEKPILLPEQIAGHQTLWAQDNIKDYPYLLINPIKDKEGNSIPSAPVGYTRVPNIPPAMAALLQMTDTDMKDILGNHDKSQEFNANLSGVAIEKIYTRLDMQSYIYISNFAKSIKRSGEIFLSMAQDIYIEEGRTVEGVNLQENLETFELMKPMINDQTGERYFDNDLSNAKMKVVVEVGPSSSTKRDSIVRSLTEMLQFVQDPVSRDVITSNIITNLEGEGLRDLKEYFRAKLIRAGAVKPSEDEMIMLEQEKANQGPTPEQEYLQAAAQKELAEAAEKRADTAYTIARAEETQAKTEKIKADTLDTLSGIDSEEERRAVQAFQMSNNLK